MVVDALEDLQAFDGGGGGVAAGVAVGGAGDELAVLFGDEPIADDLADDVRGGAALLGDLCEALGVDAAGLQGQLDLAVAGVEAQGLGVALGQEPGEPVVGEQAIAEGQAFEQLQLVAGVVLVALGDLLAVGGADRGLVGVGGEHLDRLGDQEGHHQDAAAHHEDDFVVLAEELEHGRGSGAGVGIEPGSIPGSK